MRAEIQAMVPNILDLQGIYKSLSWFFEDHISEIWPWLTDANPKGSCN